MKVRLLFLLASMCGGSLTVAQDSPATVFPEAIEFVQKTGLGETAHSTAMAAFQPALIQMQAQGVAQAGLDEVHKAAADFFAQIFKDPRFVEKLAAEYSKTFTQSELKELTAFYSTPTGKKALASMPLLLKQGMTIGENLALETAPAFQAKLAEIVKKHTPTPEAATKPLSPPPADN